MRLSFYYTMHLDIMYILVFSGVVADDLLRPSDFLPKDLPQFSWTEDSEDEFDYPVQSWVAKLTSTPRRRPTPKPALASFLLQDSLDMYGALRCVDLCEMSDASSGRPASSQLTHSDGEYSEEESFLTDEIYGTPPLSPLPPSDHSCLESSELSEDLLDCTSSSLNSTDLAPYMCSDASSLTSSRSYYDSICAGFDVSMETSGPLAGGPLCQDLSHQGPACSSTDVPLVISPIYGLCTEV